MSSANLDPDAGRCGYDAQFEPLGNGPITPEEALEGINKIRNSIVGLQTINWSEHIYPLVSLLNRAGLEGMPYPEAKANFGTCLDQRNKAIALLKEHIMPTDEQRAESAWRTFRERVGAFLAEVGER